VRASCCKPRLPVALDYLDVYEGKDVITRFESVDFAIADETRGKLTELVFHLELNQEVARFGIAVEAVSMYTNAGQWRRIQLTRRQSTIFAIGRQEDVRTFCDYMAKTKDRNNFLAIKFTRVPLGQGALRPSLDRYDFNSWWCFEFQVDFSTSGRSLVQWAPTRKQYVIERDKKRAEIPDFNWRRKKTPSKYA
jgi:hypothetical protein